jgi:TolA-binding protein
MPGDLLAVYDQRREAMPLLKRAIRLLILLVLAGQAVSFGASKEIVQLQRDVALLQYDLRSLQRSLDQSLGGTRALTQQTLDRVNQIHAANVAGSENAAKNWDKLNLTVATLGTRLDQSISEYVATRETMNGLSSRLARLEQRLEDIANSVTELQSSTRRPSPSEVLGGPPPGMTAETLFQSALRDKLAGRLDMALDEFTQYVRYYGDTELAASSQFYIGEIHYHRGELPSAEEALSKVIERYPKSGKAADALFMRALLREKEGEHVAARDDLNRLLKTYSGSDAARRATAELKRMSRRAESTRARSR